MTTVSRVTDATRKSPNVSPARTTRLPSRPGMPSSTACHGGPLIPEVAKRGRRARFAGLAAGVPPYATLEGRRSRRNGLRATIAAVCAARRGSPVDARGGELPMITRLGDEPATSGRRTVTDAVASKAAVAPHRRISVVLVTGQLAGDGRQFDERTRLARARPWSRAQGPRP